MKLIIGYKYLIPIVFSFVLILLPLCAVKAKRAYMETRKSITSVNFIDSINSFGKWLFTKLRIMVPDSKIEQYNFHAQNLKIPFTYYGLKSAHVFTFSLSIPIAYTVIRINIVNSFTYGLMLALVVFIIVALFPSIYFISKKEHKKAQWKKGIDMLEALTIFALRQTFKANNSDDTVGSVKFSEYLEIVSKNCPQFSKEFEKGLRIYMTNRKDGLRYLLKMVDIPETKRIITIASAIDDKGAGNIAELLQDLRELRNSLKESNKKAATQHVTAIMIFALGIPFAYSAYYLILPWILAVGGTDIKIQ